MSAKSQSPHAFPALFSSIVDALALPAAALDLLTVTGNEDLPSCFPVTDLAVAAIGAAGLATSQLLALEGRKSPGVTVDRHLASAWFISSVRTEGWQLPAAWDPIAGDYRSVDGWIRLHTNAPRHRAAALATLGCAAEREAVAAAVSRVQAETLEAEILKAGGCAAAMHTMAEWRSHEQGRAVRAERLIALEATTAATRLAWRPDPQRPLAGIKVLDLTRILAGPVATRFLAGLGADVLRIDPPDWDEPALAPDVTPGKHCARLDLRDATDRQAFEVLLTDADILVHGYRPAALQRLGYGEARRRALNPALIDISLCAYGWSGPWAGRRGFDSLVQMSSGIAAAGMGWKAADRPVPLPVQALDHATGYLMAAAAIQGLIARLRDNRAVSAKLSLARTALLLTDHAGPSHGPADSGFRDDDYGTTIEDMPWGPALRLRSPVLIGGMPLLWTSPACELGSSQAVWRGPVMPPAPHV